MQRAFWGTESYGEEMWESIRVLKQQAGKPDLLEGWGSVQCGYPRNLHKGPYFGKWGATRAQTQWVDGLVVIGFVWKSGKYSPLNILKWHLYKGVSVINH